jgi:hypothetical protein
VVAVGDCLLSPLKEPPLTTIEGDFHPARDTNIVRAIKMLETINFKPADEFWNRLEKK